MLSVLTKHRKREEGNFWMWWVCGLLWGDGFMGLCICPNQSNCTQQLSTFLDISFSSIKLFLKRREDFKEGASSMETPEAGAEDGGLTCLVVKGGTALCSCFIV